MKLIIGTILIVIGLAIRVIAILQLRSNFSLMLKKPMNIKKDGFYRYIRHPSYVGSIIIIGGVCLFSIEAAIMLVSVIFFLARAINEEQILSYHFPEEYADYQKKTGMFIPKFLRKKKEN